MTDQTNYETWGTLEELLLASAVNRHGTTSWDSIATELHKHTHSSFFSPHICNQQYLQITRRFRLPSGEDTENAVVDELRKRRVHELKRALHRHDLSILSLESKVKRLEEERENEQSQQGSDLTIRKSNRYAPASGGKTDKFDSVVDLSLDESNSASPAKEREPVGKVLADPVGKIEPVKESGSGNVESVSELKRESEVHSSARRRRFSNGDEEVSPANNIKSQPLIRFMDTIRSHKHGSVFQRRLPSQKTEKYGSMIREHMDLNTVESKLESGIYSNWHTKFYRDLILVFTNAILFYRKRSAEHLAARELRKLVIARIRSSNTTSSTSIVDCHQHNLGNVSDSISNHEKKAVIITREKSSGNLRVNGNNITKKGSTEILKKQGVANFLKKMKQNENKDNSDEEKVIEISGKNIRGDVKRNINNNNNNNNSNNVVFSRRKVEREAKTDARLPKRKAAMVSRTTESSGKGGGRSSGRDSNGDGDKSKKKARR